MKLNCNGWSLKEMILFSSVLLVFLLIAIFNIMRLYHGVTDASNHNSSQSETAKYGIYTYEEIEDLVLNAGLDYYNELYDGEKDVKITTNKMKKQNLLKADSLIPNTEQKECIGYVLFKNGEPSVFIECQKYKTEGYEE